MTPTHTDKAAAIAYWGNDNPPLIGWRNARKAKPPADFSTGGRAG